MGSITQVKKVLTSQYCKEHSSNTYNEFLPAIHNSAKSESCHLFKDGAVIPHLWREKTCPNAAVVTFPDLAAVSLLSKRR